MKGNHPATSAIRNTKQESEPKKGNTALSVGSNALKRARGMDNALNCLETECHVPCFPEGCADCNKKRKRVK